MAAPTDIYPTRDAPPRWVWERPGVGFTPTELVAELTATFGLDEAGP